MFFNGGVYVPTLQLLLSESAVAAQSEGPLDQCVDSCYRSSCRSSAIDLPTAPRLDIVSFCS